MATPITSGVQAIGLVFENPVYVLALQLDVDSGIGDVPCPNLAVHEQFIPGMEPAHDLGEGTTNNYAVSPL